MDKKQLEELFEKYLNGTYTPEEKALIESLDNKLLKEEAPIRNHPDYDFIKASIFDKLPQPYRPSFFKRYRSLSIAASLLIFIAVGAVIYKYSATPVTDNTLTQAPNNDVLPGGNKAILTLANGKKIVLTDAANGQLAKQAGISITKTKDGQLVYKVSADANAAIEYNTTETPIGGQYQVELADGTKAWLNSGSSLRYPTRFAGKERLVELIGEGYFEVAHNAAMPFKVKTSKEVVTVLGTHFNINAYNNEPSLRTTLVEGKVEVSSVDGTLKKILRPGEQASLKDNKLTVAEADIEEATAWKNGYFRFRGEDIESIMRKLSRWYNIEVQYQGKVSGDFYGTTSRFKNISQVLTALSETGTIHFKVEGRRVIVMQ